VELKILVLNVNGFEADLTNHSPIDSSNLLSLL